MQNPYEILGLEPGAPLAEVKRAFRKLAMTWHPDRNPAGHAEEHFKLINAAYELILDPQRYADWLAEHAAAPPKEKPEAAAEPDAETIDLELSLEEAAFGCTHTLKLDVDTPCPTCAGSGRQQHAHSVACEDCGGVGRVRHGRSTAKCHACNGRGYVRVSRCADCQGRGSHNSERRLEVRIPPGTLAGDRLRLARQGKRGAADTKAADLFLHIRLTPHPLFTLHGRDLHCEVPVSVFQLLLGGAIEIPTLRGTQMIELIPPPRHDSVYRLDGLGYPGKHGRRGGDLHCRLQPVYPACPDHADRQLLNRMQRSTLARLAERAPELAAWEECMEARRRR